MNEPQSGLRDRLDQPVESAEGLRVQSVRGAVYMGGAGAIESVGRLVATVILARILSPQDIGLVAMVIVLLGLLEFVKDLGLGIVTMQRQDITHQEVSTLFWINVLLGTMFCVLLSALSPLISIFYGDDRLVLITLALAPSLLLGGIVVQPEALLSRQMKQGPLAFIRLVSTLLSSALAIVLAVVGFGYWSLVAREVARAAFSLVGTWWYLKWVPALTFQFRSVLQHLKMGTDLSFAFVITAITGKIDAILVGKFFGPVDLGLYRQAQGLIVAPIEQFNAPVYGVAQPALSALQSEPDRYRRFYQRMTGFVAMVTMPIGVFIAVYASEFTLVLLGAKWVDAAPFVRAFALAMALRPTVHSCTMVLVTLGKTKPLIGLELANSMLFALFVVVGLQLNAVSVAIAFVATSVAFIPLRIHFSFKDTPVSARAMFSAVRTPLAATAVMGLTLLVYEASVHVGRPLLSLVAGIAVGFVTYTLAWLLLPGGRSELMRLVKDLRGAMKRRRVAT
jgi:PST family polysaccharide transporter